MIHIAICDDEEVFVEKIRSEARTVLETQDEDFEIFCYTDGNKLLADYEAKKFDLVLLDIDMPDVDGFDSKDIVCLLSNAIDNAIEASAKENNKRMDINIYKKKSYLCISVTNRISESVLGRNKQLKTTKVENTQNHGYGVKSCRDIIEKYNGMEKFENSNDEFKVRIMLGII